MRGGALREGVGLRQGLGLGIKEWGGGQRAGVGAYLRCQEVEGAGEAG